MNNIKALILVVATILTSMAMSPELCAQGQVKRQGTTSLRPRTTQPSSGQRKTQPAKRGKETEGTIGGHKYVDLGLSVKWAVCNLGASSPEQSGDFYAWGETRPKNEYTEGNSLTFGKTVSELISMGIINRKGFLNSAYDAASVNWGNGWKMPTIEQLGELREKCQITWTTYNGINGYRVTGPNGKSIFLPAAGSINGSAFYDVGKDGNYYSSQVDGNRDMWFLLLRPDSFVCGTYVRFGGRSIRPVHD